jgi:DNA end-binding protein Ku
MAPRSIWNGTVSVGLINVPIKLFTATESKTVRFREVHLADAGKVEHRRFCSAEDVEVPYAEVVKGFEVGEGEYVVLSKEEVAAAAGERGKVIELESFVDAHAIDPVFFAKTYYVGAGDKGEDAYRLLHEALGKAGRAGIGRFTFHNREYLAALRPLDGVLALHTMRFADEVVKGKSIKIEDSKAPSDREIEMAGKLISSLHEKFDPDKRTDEYRAAVLEMIERKADGKEPAKPKEKPPEETPDLLAALEASLGGKG